ncbi:DDE transposase family protein [Fodinisporobacter ferrooxydans]|uniref:DDE transposase family protein n=1 Tax=Fodinisporobacter ferrooxydans TaxID=2901836 RepID=A0ABY4CLG0_9BACL|nr:DDE transposase family protein [Alicyclobacillaceae bacterium MYW30-H2]
MDKPKKTVQQRPKRPDNVIPFRLDAAFFFERALRHLDRRDLKSSLKYFRKAVEYEPDNPVHHCNLAGVLSELGRFEESNEILRTILEDIDSSMSECYFYMANNFANLGEYDLAEEYADLYLQCEPKGEFVQDAEEMLEILIEDFGGGEVLRKRREEQLTEQTDQDKARKLLEAGKFMEASVHLQNIIHEFPNATAPKNNLSLAYYYLGQMDQAVALSEEVLENDPSNIHAICNLAVYFQHLGKQDRLKTIIAQLRKLYPLNFDHTYKLATTMGILGEHASAYHLFKQLVHFTDRSEISLLHCVAAAAANLGNLKAARKYWQEIKQLDRHSEVAEYYLNKLEEFEKAPESAVLTVSYQYHIPFHEQFRRIQQYLQENKIDSWQQDPFIRSSLFWALKHGDVETKLQVIHIFAWMGGQEIEQVLREFIQTSEELASLKLFAVYVLRHIGAQGICEVRINDRLETFQIQLLPLRHKAWKTNVHNIVLCALEMLRDHLPQWQYERVLERVFYVWNRYLETVQDSPPRINKIPAWAAGLVYASLSDLPEFHSKSDVARMFDVSVASVTRIANSIFDCTQ